MNEPRLDARSDTGDDEMNRGKTTMLSLLFANEQTHPNINQGTYVRISPENSLLKIVPLTKVNRR
jgi:hypothetical protein